MQHDTIAVIDFGGQYAHLIATKIRRHGVRAEIRQPEDPVEAYTTRDRLDVLREADTIIMEALRRFDLYDDVWQCPTVLVPLSLTDEPGETVIVRPIRSQRAMTATPVELPAVLVLVSELRDQVLGLDRITALALDVTSKPPGTIEWE